MNDEIYGGGQFTGNEWKERRKKIVERERRS